MDALLVQVLVQFDEIGYYEVLWGTVELLVDSRMDGGRMGDPDHTAL